MAPGSIGELILLPINKRSCFDCDQFGEFVDGSGVTSWCDMYDEEIHDEGIADTCENWELK